jgi:sugar lactone lactonase YvrE
MISKPELLLDAHAPLGEGPVWSGVEGLLYWVDIYAGCLHAFHPKEKADVAFQVGESLGCAAPRAGGGWVVGLRSGFAFLPRLSFPASFPQQKGLPPIPVEPQRFLNPEPDLPGNRFNDGKCDPRGRFLAGTMDNAEQMATGSLYALWPDRQAKTLLTGTRISNGLAWSPDHSTFYFIDTPTRQVTAYDYDLNSGEIANPRPVVSIPPEMGWPDGMTSDTEGMLWVALWGGAKLTRWNPQTGRLLKEIPFPALNISSCCFGGPDLTDLYVTSAAKGMSEAQQRQYPASGGLFRLKTNIQGMPVFQYGG